MSSKECEEQLNSLVEAWQLNEADLNQTDIDAMQHLLLENQMQQDKIIELKIQVSSREEVAKKYKEVIDKIQKHCEIEINASNHYLENHSSQKELCHKVAHQRILDIIKEVE